MISKNDFKMSGLLLLSGKILKVKNDCGAKNRIKKSFFWEDIIQKECLVEKVCECGVLVGDNGNSRVLSISNDENLKNILDKGDKINAYFQQLEGSEYKRLVAVYIEG